MFLRVSLDLAPGSLLVKLQLKTPSWTQKTTVTDNFHTLFLDMLELPNIDQDSVFTVTSFDPRTSRNGLQPPIPLGDTWCKIAGAATLSRASFATTGRVCT